MKHKLVGLDLAVKVIFYAVSVWLVVHSLAIFGIFIAVAYPIWWVLFPKKTICFWCRIKIRGKKCFFCRRANHPGTSHSPPSLTAVIFNAALIFLISALSLGMVFVETRSLQKLNLAPIAKTASFVIPTKGQFLLGEIFTTAVNIDYVGHAINAVQADIKFDPDKVEVVDISSEGSFATIFIQKEINNQAGFARLTGGLPNPGFNEKQGLFATVVFKTKAPGLVHIEFLPSSLVLANDTKGTNVLRDLPSVAYLILPERISAEAEVRQTQTVSNPQVLGETTEGVQMKFYDETTVLGTTSAQTISPKTRLGVLLGIGEKVGRLNEMILSFWQKVFGL